MALQDRLTKQQAFAPTAAGALAMMLISHISLRRIAEKAVLKTQVAEKD
jgi:hypothetical protein